jgi:hypothetical protein
MKSMARTLYVVEDSTFTNLPEDVRKKTMAELPKLLGFIKNFKVVSKQPAQFPSRFDFTDSIVKIVDTEGEVGAAQNQSIRQQLKNIEFSVTQNGAKLADSDPKHHAATPERGGVGFQVKQIINGGAKKMAMTLTGGIASLEFVKEEVVDHFAGGRTRKEIVERQRKMINGTANRKGMGPEKYHASDDGKLDKRHLAALDMLGVELKNWPKDFQEAAGFGLARLIAHEARHQYVAPHFEGGGLGAGEADIFGDKNFEHFDTEDQKEINTTLTELERLQQTATVHLETIPKGKPFIF